MLGLRLLLLLHVCVYSVLYGGMPDATGARWAVRAWGVLCVLRVARPHAQEPRARLHSSPTARACSKNEQHKEQLRRHAAAVDKAHGGVIDDASASCQPSAVSGHMTLSAFAAASR